jgi:hypothetical protein
MPSKLAPNALPTHLLLVKEKARDDAESQTHGLVALSVNCVFFQGKSRIGVRTWCQKKKKKKSLK